MKRISKNVLVISLSITVLALIIVTSISANAADIVTFKGTETTPSGAPLMLTGKLTKPQGDGPFPAIALLDKIIIRGGQQYAGNNRINSLFYRKTFQYIFYANTTINRK